MRHTRLTEEERRELDNLYKTSINSVVRGRCMSLLLSNKGKSIVEVANLLNIHRHAVRRLIHKWDALPCEDRLSALYSAKGQGAKAKLELVAKLLPDLVEKYSRNLKPILDTLEKEHSIKVSKVTLQSFLKGVGLFRLSLKDKR